MPTRGRAAVVGRAAQTPRRYRMGDDPAVAKASWELLLALEHEEGVAGVYRDRANGSYWLSGNENGNSGMTEQRFRVEGLHNAWVYGGFLPADATRVLARDAHAAWSEGVVGNGVWLAITRTGARSSACSGRGRTLERACSTRAARGLALLPPVHAGESEHRAVVCLRCRHQVAMGTPRTAPSRRARQVPGGRATLVCEPRRRQ